MRKKNVLHKVWHGVSLLVILLGLNVFPGGASGDHPGITPSAVEDLIFPGDFIQVEKTVHTPEIPPLVELCLLEDETGSFGDDISNLQGGTTASDIYDNVIAVSPGAQFAVAGFRDYPVSPHGGGGDWVYRLLSSMSPVKANWLNGIAALTAGGGADTPEAQYDAIVAAVQGGFGYNSCGFSGNPNVTPVLVVTTDAPFHLPGGGKPHVNTLASTTAVLNGPPAITLVGLKAPGAGGELNALAAATGGNVQPLSSNGANIASAIVAGLSNLPVEVEMVSDCAYPISVNFSPAKKTVTSGDDAVFTETIMVDANASGGTYTCKDWALIDGEPMRDEFDEIIYETKTIHVPGLTLTPETDTNELLPGAEHTVTATVTAGDYGAVDGVSVEFEITSGPNVGASSSGFTNASGQVSFTYSAMQGPGGLGIDGITSWLTEYAQVSDSATKEWVDTTPPVAYCTETVNPHGEKAPEAPGNGGQGQNQDGFYEMTAEDLVWPAGSLGLFVYDDGSGTVFGPFAFGTRMKYTEANGATPNAKSMGGNNGNGNGQGEAVEFHITGNGDAFVFAVDGSGNTSDMVACLVPPPPK